MTPDDDGRFPLGRRSVRRIGFGAMQLPGPGVFGPPRDREEALAVVRRAVDLGVDHIDTAQYYGPAVANELLREALHPFPEGLTLVSKVGARRDEKGGWFPAGTPAELRAGVQDNLRTLGVEQIHVVNLRRGDLPAGAGGQVSFDEQLDAMVEVRDEGLVGDIGLSNVSVEELRHGLARTRIACVQNLLNVADRASLPVLRECTDRGVAFVPFFPLGSGFRGRNKVLDHPDVAAAAGRLGGSAAQVALAWLLALAPNTLLIPGTSSLAHLEENLAAGSLVLDGDTLRALDDVTA